eukprot:6532109-Pyramimonas_sp.AAC.1
MGATWVCGVLKKSVPAAAWASCSLRRSAPAVQTGAIAPARAAFVDPPHLHAVTRLIGSRA